MKFKRFLTGAFFVVCMIFMSCFVVSAASSGKCGLACAWTLDDEGTLTISGSGRMTDYSKNSYQSIPWYSHMAEIKKAVIDGPETIGERAFFYARNMKEVVIGSSVKSIGEAAFTGCTSECFFTFYCTGCFFCDCSGIPGMSCFCNYCAAFCMITP